MKLGGHQIVGVMCIGGGVVAYVWLMAAALVPTTVELAEAFSVPIPAPIAWIGLTAAGPRGHVGFGQWAFAQTVAA